MTEKERFMDEVILALSIEGAFQRAKVYKAHVSDHERSQLRDKLREYLIDISSHYKDVPITEEQHISYIEYLAKKMTTTFGSILANDEFRIGVAQKVLNLYLKYLWCLDLSTKPPHCPFDSTVLFEIGKNDVSWTKIRTIAGYKLLVEAAKCFAGDEPLADWELRTWDEKHITCRVKW